MQIKKMTITPTIAGKWLDKNFESNRKIKRAQVTKIANDIIAGRWHLTGDLIRFNPMGFLIDGQHRLTAVLQANKQIESYVAFDVPDETKKVIDTGVTRSAADLLTIAGMGQNAKQTAALTKRILTWKAKKGSIVLGRGYSNRRFTNQDIIEFVEKNDLVPYLSFGWKIYGQCVNPKMFSATDWSTMFWIFSQLDKAKAEEFLTLLGTIDGINRRHPIRVLFDKLNNTQVPLTGGMKMRFVIKTWNTWRKGDNDLKLTYHDLENEVPELI